jgi:hypothetical protein
MGESLFGLTVFEQWGGTVYEGAAEQHDPDYLQRVFILLAVLGMSSVVHSMGHWFVLINCLGAAYLLWMGIRMLRARVKSIEIEGIDEPS